MDRNEEMTREFGSRFGGAPDLIVRAPGRVNLIGEHTDYNDGFVLPLAIDYDVRIAARARADRTVRLYSADFRQHDAFDLDAVRRVGEQPTWADYPRGVVYVLLSEGHRLQGLDGVVAGNVPVGAGLSSSAAIELATATAFRLLDGLDLDPVRAALLCQRAENEFVGMRCGIMDQFISSLGQEGHALLIDCRSLEHSPVPVPPGAAVVVADSGVRRGLVGSTYNERRAQCEEGARQLGVRALRDLSREEFAARRDQLPALTARRCEHVVEENGRVIDCVAALGRGDLETVGALMNASHASLRDLYEVSTAELDLLAEIQQGSPGCWGARLTGAGFGGCTVALVAVEAVASTVESILSRYPARTGRMPQVYVCRAAGGAGLA